MPQTKFNKLAGKHVIVIGGTAGIGYAVAEGAIEYGARVTVSSSNPSRVEKAVKSLKESYPGSSVQGFPCDLSKPTLEEDIEKLFEKTGTVDHIVFTSGDALAMIPLQEMTFPKVIAAGQIRFFAALFVAKIGSRYMTEGPESSILLTTGSVSEHPIPNWSVVASYAAGLGGMTRNLALDLKPRRVNLVCLGVIDTELWRMSDIEKEGFFKSVAARVPTGRVAKPESVAEAYLWLMKDSNVTGTIVNSDSGTKLV